MSNNLSYGFDFRANSKGGEGALGFATIRLYIGDLQFAILEGFSVRENDRGVWLAAPQRAYKNKMGEQKYQKYIYLWPKGGDTDVDTSQYYQEFQEAFKTAWEEFCAAPVQETAQRPARTGTPVRTAAPVTRPSRPIQETQTTRAPVRTVTRPAPVTEEDTSLDIFSTEGVDAFDAPPLPTRIRREN